MALPYFYSAEIASGSIVLNEENSKHIVNVLRMKNGDGLLLTDGKGKKAACIITDDHRKHCTVEAGEIIFNSRQEPTLAIALSITRSNDRFEWFLEKATEIGISQIMPLICERTAKEKFRYDRMQQIVISAMLQSQQVWMPELFQPMAFNDVLELEYKLQMIAHCEEENKQPLTAAYVDRSEPAMILIGPEGDFTLEEIHNAIAHRFQPISLGDTRLRTETAGVVAATLMRLGR